MKLRPTSKHEKTDAERVGFGGLSEVGKAAGGRSEGTQRDEGKDKGDRREAKRTLGVPK